MSRAAWPEKVNASMFATLAKKLFGSSNDRTLKQFQKRVPAINAHEADTARLSDAELAARTAAFRQRVANGESLDDLLPEAFAFLAAEGCPRGDAGAQELGHTCKVCLVRSVKCNPRIFDPPPGSCRGARRCLGCMGAWATRERRLVR